MYLLSSLSKFDGSSDVLFVVLFLNRHAFVFAFLRFSFSFAVHAFLRSNIIGITQQHSHLWPANPERKCRTLTLTFCLPVGFVTLVGWFWFWLVSWLFWKRKLAARQKNGVYYRSVNLLVDLVELLPTCQLPWRRWKHLLGPCSSYPTFAFLLLPPESMYQPATIPFSSPLFITSSCACIYEKGC